MEDGPQQPLPIWTKLWFGFGQIAEGLKSRVFETFLFFYYEQVLGLSAGLAAGALVLAVIWDAASDPLVGSVSDSWRSRWGRRHPFMYAAAVPLGVTFVLLFRPPEGLGPLGLFTWLTLFSILSRTALTLYSIPHFALGAELSDDYHERTSVVAFRSWFQQIAAWSITPIAFAVFFRSSASFANGQLDPAAYAPFAVFFGIVMVIAVLASAAGTHDRIASLPQPLVGAERPGPRRILSELRSAMRSRSFVAFIGAVLIFSIGAGLQRVLELYMRTYFWSLSPDQIFRISLVELVGAIVGISFWARASRRLGKKTTFSVGILLYGAFLGLPPLAMIMGYFVPAESASYAILLGLFGGLAAFGSSGHYVVGGSLMADLADEHELATGHRSAGLLFGVINFASKFTPVAGIGFASLVLAWIGLPKGAAPDAISSEAITRLGLFYGPSVFLFMAVSVVVLARYRISRQRLFEIQQILRERSRGLPVDEGARP